MDGLRQDLSPPPRDEDNLRLGAENEALRARVAELEALAAGAEDRLAARVQQLEAAQAQAQQQWSCFQAILATYPGVLYIADPETYEILLVNRPLAELFGRPLAGECCYEALQNRDTPCDFCTNERIQAQPGPYTWTYHNTVVDRHYHITDQMIPWPDGRSVRFEVASDITDLQTARAELREANAELARKNAELEQVVYVASHDLRSPLVNVQGFSRELKLSLDDLAEELAKPDSPRRRARLEELMRQDLPEALQFIRTGAAKMDTLLTGLLRLSRIGRALLSPARLDMHALASDVVDSMMYELVEAGCDVELGELPPCWADSAQMNQALSNLVSNALKFRHPERPGRIHISGRRGDGAVEYCVRDNGIGIRPEHRERVFELFHRLDPGATEGDGLGLTVVARVAERLGGRVRVESEPDVGSRFFLSVPDSAGRKGATQT